MKRKPHLSRREREIMDVVFRQGKATAAEVLAAIPDPPSYSAVRSTLGILEAKGHLTHEQEGNRYIYLPTVDRKKARQFALEHLLDTFFDGSAAEVVTALIEEKGTDLSSKELDSLSRLIRQARTEGR